MEDYEQRHTRNMNTNEVIEKLRNYLVSGMFKSKSAISSPYEPLHLNAEEVVVLLEYIKYLENHK